jgi:hypothetical protein
MAIGATVPIFVRLSKQDADLLDSLAKALNAARPGTVAVALRHMARTMEQGQPVYLNGPGAGLASLATPPPGMARVLDGTKARLQARLRSKEQALRSKR